ncbi:MAG TPA: hypothetical protein DCZ91_22780 [Lachnospiraceae bacterium]|nr:hypothetical protein [Lachnospiraceae bacterium]
MSATAILKKQFCTKKRHEGTVWQCPENVVRRRPESAVWQHPESTVRKRPESAIWKHPENAIWKHPENAVWQNGVPLQPALSFCLPSAVCFCPSAGAQR